MQGKSGEEEVEEGEEKEVVVVVVVVRGNSSLEGKGVVILSGCRSPTQKLLFAFFFLGSFLYPPFFLILFPNTLSRKLKGKSTENQDFLFNAALGYNIARPRLRDVEGFNFQRNLRKNGFHFFICPFCYFICDC